MWWAWAQWAERRSSRLWLPGLLWLVAGPKCEALSLEEKLWVWRQKHPGLYRMSSEPRGPEPHHPFLKWTQQRAQQGEPNLISFAFFPPQTLEQV